MKIQTYPDLKVQQLEWSIDNFSYEFMEVSDYMIPLQKLIYDRYQNMLIWI